MCRLNLLSQLIKKEMVVNSRNVRLSVVFLMGGILVGDRGIVLGKEMTLSDSTPGRHYVGKKVVSDVRYDKSPQKKLDKLKAEKIDSLYLQAQADVLDAQQKIMAALQDKVASLKGYSKKDSDEFIDFLNDMVAGFRAQMHVEQTIMIADYFNFVEKTDPNYVYARNLAQDERLFLEGIEHITQEAVVRVQALVLDLTTQNLSNRLSTELAHDFYDSALQAQRAYEKQKEENEKDLNGSWWDRLKDEGKGFIDEFSSQFKGAVKKEVAKQAEVAIAEIGGDIASRVGGNVINFAKENISPAVAAQIGELSSRLKEEGISFLSNHGADIAIIALRKAIRNKYPVSAPAGAVVVRTSKGLCDEEKEYLKNRMPQVQKVLSEAFGISEPLRIAFCCSGGGNRAMVGTLGMFMAASRHNFLQAAVYCAGLSGSTWTIAPWSYLFLKGLVNQSSYEQSFKDLQNSYFTVLDDPSMIETPQKGIFFPPMLGSDVQTVFATQMAIRFGYDEHVSLVDVWAAFIGNFSLKIAGGDRLQVCWSELYDLARKGDIPLPLCSAAFDARLDDSHASKLEVGALYDWLETGPFEAGSTVLGYIPMKYFGSEFKDGNLVVDMLQHEYPMSFWLGVYGSAFSLTFNDVIEKGIPTPTIDVFGQEVKIPVDVWVQQIMKENVGEQTRSKRIDRIHAKFPNFSVGLKDSLLKNQAEIGLFDGGVAFNIPLPLVLDQVERGVDVVIMYDSNPADVQTLKNADAYFKRKNISMPITGDRTKKDLLSRTMTVFNDPREIKKYNSKQPTLLYFPTNVDVNNPPFTTANFKYTKNDTAKLAGIVDDAFESQVPDMTEILQMVAKARYDATGKKVL